MHGRHQRNRGIGRGERAQRLADRACRLGDAAPEPARLLGNGDVEEAGLRQSVEVGGVETAPRLALRTVRPPLVRDVRDVSSPAPTMKRS